MEPRRIPSCDGRVVVLSRDGALAVSLRSNGATRLRYVCARSAYEAAAEILAGPAVALIIDLRLLSPRALRLLEIARGLDLEVLAVGALPLRMTADDLSGVRLVSRGDIAPALETALARTTEEPREARQSQSQLLPEAPIATDEEIVEELPPPGDASLGEKKLTLTSAKSAATGGEKVRLTPAKSAAAGESAMVEDALAVVEIAKVLARSPGADAYDSRPAGEAAQRETAHAKPIETKPAAPAADSSADKRKPKAAKEPEAPTTDSSDDEKKAKAATKPTRRRSKRRRSNAAGATDEASGLLTPEELAALLGDES